jgi:2-polyprenyl-3-methyl-5-hydroxy-6-metoxy-1,4-benzoquinol methylase
MAADEWIEKMRRDWDARARENARYYIVNSRKDWPDEDFARSGEGTVAHYVLTDMGNVCQGKSPKEMRVLDFGCGAGRVTRALAGIFGEVHGVDISGEMVKLAKAQLSDLPNVRVHQTNGRDLDALGDVMFDFAFSFSVFHHVPGKALIESCIGEVAKHLRAGCLFKFEVQGNLRMEAPAGDTWLGPPLSETDIREMAERTGFEPRHSIGAGEESYWQWLFKKCTEPRP